MCCREAFSGVSALLFGLKPKYFGTITFAGVVVSLLVVNFAVYFKSTLSFDASETDSASSPTTATPSKGEQWKHALMDQCMFLGNCPPTCYPSTNLTFYPKRKVSVNVRFGEG